MYIFENECFSTISFSKLTCEKHEIIFHVHDPRLTCIPFQNQTAASSVVHGIYTGDEGVFQEKEIVTRTGDKIPVHTNNGATHSLYDRGVP